ncbi:hypothetical protein ACTA71_002483 [Dictyostelium dimigraforme]
MVKSKNKQQQKLNHGDQIKKNQSLKDKVEEQYQNQPKFQEFTEKLFWKVIKNKYIKTHIFSFLNDKSKIQNKIYKYDDINSVQFLIKNNLIELLRYKVKRGDRLIDFLPILNKRNSLDQEKKKTERKSIFKVIGNDQEFYQCLFKNYNQNFTSNEKTFNVKSLNTHFSNVLPIEGDGEYDLMIETRKQIIRDDNECAFAFFQKVNAIKTSFEDFYEAISVGSIKMAKFIFNQLKKEVNFKKHELIGKVWKNYTFLNSSSPMFKDYDKTLPPPSGSLSTLSTSSPINNKKYKIINKSIKFLLLELKLNPPKEMNNINQDIFKIDIKLIKVKHLLESCKTIAILLQHTNFFDGYLKSLKKSVVCDKFMGFEGELQTYLPYPDFDFLNIDKLNEIEQNLKPQSIGSYVHSFSNGGDNIYILQLYKMLLTFTDYSTVFRDNYIFFKCKYYNDYSLCKSANDKKIPYQMGSFENILPNSSHSSNLFQLFSFCQDEKEIQSKFINQAIENIIQASKGCKKPLIEPLNLIITLLHFDWIEFISIFYKKLKPIINDENKLVPTNIFELIKSTNTFDFYVFNLPSFRNQINLNNCLMKSSFNGGGDESNDINNYKLNLMDHIKRNHNSIYKELINSIDLNINDSINYSIESLLFIYNNIKDFENCYERVDVWKRGNIQLSLNQFIQLVKCTPINKKYNYLCGNGKSELEAFNFNSCLLKYNWVIMNKHHDLLSNRCDGYYGSKETAFNPKNIEPLYQFFNHGNLMLNEIFPRLNVLDPIIFNTSKHHPVFKITRAIGERDDIQSLETILKLIDFSTFISSSLNFFYSKFILIILKKSLLKGHIKVLQFLKSNYPFFFDEKIDFGGKSNFLESFRQYQINLLFERLRDICIIYNLVDIFNVLKNNIFFDHLNK